MKALQPSNFLCATTATGLLRVYSPWMRYNVSRGIELGLGRVVPMTDTVENLMLDLVEWVGRKERTYQETMEAWRTSCPRLPIWEDATERGFVETTFASGRSLVRVTQAGSEFLQEKRPRADNVLKNDT